MWTSTRFVLHLSLLFLLQLNMKGQADAAGHCPECCCEWKTVGKHDYTFVEFVPGGPQDCLTGCRYTRNGSGDKTQYCFAKGNEPVTCTKPGCVEMTNYSCYNGTARGIITPLFVPLRYDYTVGPAVSHTCVKTDQLSDLIENITATVTFENEPGYIDCAPYVLPKDNTVSPSKFNIGCVDGGVEKCKVYPAIHHH